MFTDQGRVVVAQEEGEKKRGKDNNQARKKTSTNRNFLSFINLLPVKSPKSSMKRPKTNRYIGEKEKKGEKRYVRIGWNSRARPTNGEERLLHTAPKRCLVG